MQTFWIIDSKQPSNAIIEDKMRLIFSPINQNSIGSYSCYSIPTDMSIRGTSKLEIKINSYDKNSVKIAYDRFDTDPTSKRLKMPTFNSFKMPTLPWYDENIDDEHRPGESNSIPRMEIIFEKPRASEIRKGDFVELICNINDNFMNCMCKIS